MQTIKITSVKLEGNVRKDYGDLTELTASIKIFGVKNPIEIDKTGSLIDGHRRLKAAKAAGLDEVPYFVSLEEKLDKTTSQILSGIFSKNLNPLEEGAAFNDFLKGTGVNAQTLASRISKPVLYVKRRLALLDLPEPVKDALIANKILMGHALLLARLPEKNSVIYLRDIIREDRSVENAKERIQYEEITRRLTDAPFDQKKGTDGKGSGNTGCTNCPYNGSQQTELSGIGRALSGNCLNTKCFDLKVKDKAKELRIKYKDVLTKETGTPRGYVGQYGHYDNDNVTEAYMEKCKKSMKNYLVRIEDHYGRIEVIEFFKIPPSKGKKKAETKEAAATESLLGRVTEFKTRFLIGKSIELMKPGAIPTKALTLLNILNSCGWSTRELLVPKVQKILGGGLSKILNSTNAKLDEAIAMVAKEYLHVLDFKELIKFSKSFGVDMKKHFVITEDFLKLHTIGQLKDLSKELKVDLGKAKGKADLVDVIFKASKNKVPKEVL